MRQILAYLCVAISFAFGPASFAQTQGLYDTKEQNLYEGRLSKACDPLFPFRPAIYATCRRQGIYAPGKEGVLLSQAQGFAQQEYTKLLVEICEFNPTDSQKHICFDKGAYQKGALQNAWDFTHKNICNSRPEIGADQVSICMMVPMFPNSSLSSVQRSVQEAVVPLLEKKLVDLDAEIAKRRADLAVLDVAVEKLAAGVAHMNQCKEEARAMKARAHLPPKKKT